MAGVTRGELFRDAKPSFFGHPVDWIVEDIFIASDGNEYARLCLTTNRHERKTLSVMVLSDRRRFIRIPPSAS